MEGKASFRRRRRLFNQLVGAKVLEVGVGTGRNLEFYSEDKDITGIDVSEKMLERARERAARLGLSVRLEVATSRNCPTPIDSVVSACAFCSVPDLVKGLREIRRVLRPKGRLLMLEHVLSCRPVIREVMHILNPAVK